MSMLSAQCDRLRELADRFDVLAPENAILIRSAADTIWELRCKLNDEQDENARLRSCLTDAAENARLIMGEVAQLRELVVALYHVHFGTEAESWDAWEDFCPCSICEERHGGEAPCAYTAKDLADECCEPITKEIVIDRMRELGVEP